MRVRTGPAAAPAPQPASSLAGSPPSMVSAFLPSLIPASREDAAWEAQRHNPVRKFALFFALVVIFVRFSMIHEVLQYLYGAKFYLLYIFGAPAMLGILFTAGIQRCFRSKAAYYWLGFGLWMVIATPFSSWRGGSFDTTVTYWKTELPMLFIAGGLLFTWKECKWLFATMAAAAIFNLASSSYLMREVGGRIDLEMMGASIGNSNDLAGHLILMMPFLLYFVLAPKIFSIVRAAALVLIAYGLYLALGSGSRGALVAVAVAVVFLIVKAPGKARVATLLVAPILAIGLVLYLPQGAMDRLTKFTDGEVLAPDEAAESQRLRTYVFRKSLQHTMTHPVFGIGPGQFASYEGGAGKAEGRRGVWIQTHNVYTQISSECGIPALILYVAGIVATFGLMRRTYIKSRLDPRNHDISAAAFCIMLSLVGFCSAITFLTVGYRFYLPAFAGFAIAFYWAAEREMQARALARPRPLSA